MTYPYPENAATISTNGNPYRYVYSELFHPLVALRMHFFLYNKKYTTFYVCVCGNIW